MRRRLFPLPGYCPNPIISMAAIGASSASLPKSKVVGVLTVPNSTADGRVFTRPQARDIATEPHCAIRKETGVVGVLRSRLAIDRLGAGQLHGDSRCRPTRKPAYCPSHLHWRPSKFTPNRRRSRSSATAARSPCASSKLAGRAYCAR
jgi:hypothetical protein